ncbi:prepilin-type N-terminal cleavage/methylation domain-containing protein [uncultured Thomasclavelia sp.]|uniref:prepilin-type N-terminal cleavage/methylation domain-containing protein n=1 Tax=uncultured Thomasclavelia sp. TaxID=3025759 RepID=UPI00280B51EB|nr:prepilin-type N-terminal cleavage/methylation domain-containing protein [uncultured Thomasclavelia sp.]
MEWQQFVHNDKRGFTLIEVLFSLSICLLIILNTVPILKVITVKDNLEITTSSFSLGANQISKILFTAKDIQVSDSLIYTNEDDEQFTISLDNGRVVKEPGFDILIHNVDELSFYQNDRNIYMELNRDDNNYTYLIACDYQINEEENETSTEIEEN